MWGYTFLNMSLISCAVSYLNIFYKIYSEIAQAAPHGGHTCSQLKEREREREREREKDSKTHTHTHTQ